MCHDSGDCCLFGLANEITTVPLPDKSMQPYHVVVDSKHKVWGNLWTSDHIIRLDPANNTWTTFDLPVRGTEIRHIALAEKNGKLSVVMPVVSAIASL